MREDLKSAASAHVLARPQHSPRFSLTAGTTAPPDSARQLQVERTSLSSHSARRVLCKTDSQLALYPTRTLGRPCAMEQRAHQACVDQRASDPPPGALGETGFELGPVAQSVMWSVRHTTG